MMAQEQPFCDVKGNIVVINMLTILKSLKSQRLSFENISNAYTVAKECFVGKSDSWLVHANFENSPIVETIPLTKKKPSAKTAKLMADYYQASAKEDLALAKEFEGIESEIDVDCSQ